MPLDPAFIALSITLWMIFLATLMPKRLADWLGTTFIGRIFDGLTALFSKLFLKLGLPKSSQRR